MSALTRDEIYKLNKPARKISRFWLVSITLHVLAIAAVVFIGPVREIVFVREYTLEPNIITRGDDLEQIIDDIRDVTAERLMARVALLREGQRRMAVNFNTLNLYFQPFQEHQLASAMSRFSHYANEALRRQEIVIQAMASVGDNNSAYQAVRTAQEQIPRIFTAQDEIRRGIQLLPISGDEILMTQRESEDQQHQTHQFVRWLDDSLRGIDENQKRLAKALEDFALLEPLIIEEKRKVLAADAAQIEAEKEKTQFERLRASAMEAQEHERARELENSIRQANDRIYQSRNRGNDTRRELQHLERRFSDAVNSQYEALRRIPYHESKRDEFIQTSGNIQRSALLNQRVVIDAVMAATAGTEKQ